MGFSVLEVASRVVVAFGGLFVILVVVDGGNVDVVVVLSLDGLSAKFSNVCGEMSSFIAAITSGWAVDGRIPEKKI